jgi:hypothetical protein
MSALENDIIEVLLKHNIVNEHSLRDYRIKTDYKKYREDGLTGKEARIKLSEENNLGLKTIEYILYNKKQNSEDS